MRCTKEWILKNDIDNKIIRCVGNPDIRFNEDALRILRGLRFASTLGFGVEKNTAESIKNNAVLLQKVSVERIFVELKKMLFEHGFMTIEYVRPTILVNCAAIAKDNEGKPMIYSESQKDALAKLRKENGDES